MMIKKGHILTESKEKLPLSFLADFISKCWDEAGYLKETAKVVKQDFRETAEIEEIIQNLTDAYLVCIGQMEAYMQDKKYIEYPEASKKDALEEAIEIKIDNDKVEVAADEEVSMVADVDSNKVILSEPCDSDTCEVEASEAGAEAVVSEIEAEAPEAEVELEDTEEVTEEPIYNNNEKVEQEVADFFVDFDDPIGAPITDKELYGDEEVKIENEKLDADVD